MPSAPSPALDPPPQAASSSTAASAALRRNVEGVLRLAVEEVELVRLQRQRDLLARLGARLHRELRDQRDLAGVQMDHLLVAEVLDDVDGGGDAHLAVRG